MSFLNTTSGSNVVTVNLNNNGALNGDYVTFSDITGAVGGIPASELNTNHLISNAQTNSFTIETTTAATSTATYSGPFTAQFDIHAGNQIAVFGYGWGTGQWAAGPGVGVTGATLLRTWGSGSNIPINTPPRLISQDRFNNNLLFCIRGGDIYIWQYTNLFNTRAVALSSLSTAADVPQLVGSILVSQQDRHLLAFGCTSYATNSYDPMLIRWASQDAPEFWTPGNITVPSTGQFSSAGFLRVSNGSEIVRGLRTREEILVFTDSTLYSLRFLGTDEVFALAEMADNISVMSPNVFATINNVTFWMGVDKFYIYNGRVDTLPCTLRQQVFQDINRVNAVQSICGTNEQFNEVIWFYPSADSTELNRYVIYNYVEQIWYYGELARTAWLDSATRQYPQAAGTTRWLYNHEDGVDADGEPLVAFISSGDIDIEDGDNFMLVRRVIPDINFTGSTATNPEVEMTIKPRNFPGALYRTNNLENTGLTKDVIASRDQVTAIIDQYTNQVFIRTRGRQISYKIASDGLGVQWQLGMPRVDARPDGRRG